MSIVDLLMIRSYIEGRKASYVFICGFEVKRKLEHSLTQYDARSVLTWPCFAPSILGDSMPKKNLFFFKKLFFDDSTKKCASEFLTLQHEHKGMYAT